MPIPITWKGDILLIERLVLPACRRSDSYEHALHELAKRLHLEVSDEYTMPYRGDFWLGCEPADGWDDVPTGEVGIATQAEIPPAILRLLTAASWFEQRGYGQSMASSLQTAS